MDVVSAALLKEAQKFSRCTRGVYICDRDGFQLSMWCYGCLLRNVLAALASRPAPATDTASAALAKEWADVNKECGATDYPVWGDGSHDTVTCARPAGHEGPHTGLIGAHQWTW